MINNSNSKDDKKIKITCRFGTHNERIISVFPDDHLCILLDKLKLKDRKSKFIFNGQTFDVASILKFSEIEIKGNCKISIINQAIAGKKIND